MTDDSSESLESLKPVRIHFNTKKDQIDGFYTLMTSGKPVQAPA